MPPAGPAKPTWRYERRAQRQGFEHIAGIDEAGRGPLAGPVVASAVVFPSEARIKDLNDSKQLTHEHRRALADEIRAKALGVGVGIASAEEIDAINVLAATHLAARRAVEALPLAPDYFITDYLRLAWTGAPVEPLVKGDARCCSVAAASIIAKVTRDALMHDYDGEYPGYGFASHKGYTCRAHLDALHTLGPTTIHRLTFRGVCWFDTELRHSKTFDHLAEAIEAIDGENAARHIQRAIDNALTRMPEREGKEIQSLFAAQLKRRRLRLP